MINRRRMKYYNKLKWILGIVMVFVLIATTNLIDRNNFFRVKDAVETLYQDRLIANDLLFDLSQSIQEKELAVKTSDTLFFANRNAQVNREIQSFVDQYAETQLTEDEARTFEQLKAELLVLDKEEKQLGRLVDGEVELLSSSISKIKTHLLRLSKIQLLEGRRQVSISNKAIETVELYTHIEIYLLAFLAIVVQILILYTPKKD